MTSNGSSPLVLSVGRHAVGAFVPVAGSSQELSPCLQLTEFFCAVWEFTAQGVLQLRFICDEPFSGMDLILTSLFINLHLQSCLGFL